MKIDKRARGVTRRNVLTACGSLLLSDVADSARDSDEARPLHEIAARNGLAVGAAVNTNIFTDPAYAALISRECGVLVAENHFKWGLLRHGPSHFNPSVADRIISFAKTHDMRMRGHTLFFRKPYQNGR